MKKLITHFSNLVGFSFIFFLCFFFADRAHSQDFVTVWTFSDNAPVIRFNALTTGDVNYTWTASPSSQTGQGNFNSIEGGRVTLDDLNIEIGDTLTLSMSPEHLSRFFSDLELRKSPEILIDVKQWGEVNWTSMDSTFFFREKVNFSASDIPNLAKVPSMRNVFFGAINFNSDISAWDVSNVTNMSGLFYKAEKFNRDISGWDVSKVSDMSNMFNEAGAFDQEIGDWDVFNVTDMSWMFSSSRRFNQDLNSWDVSNVTNMSYMFRGASDFNQELNNWNVSNVTDMSGLFASAASFNQNIESWDVSKVTNMSGMFGGSKAFSHDIGSWDVSNVTNMSGMFVVSTFNGDIGQWDVSKVNDMSGMFVGATEFNQDLSNWNTENVTNMFLMFSETEKFNSNIGTWNTQNVTDMSYMFSLASAFNQEIGDWDVSNVVNMSNMFYNANSFNQDLSNWNTSQVINMNGIFSSTLAFNGDIHKWDFSNALDMTYMFYEASAFNQDISGWKINPEADMEGMLDYSGLDCVNYSKAIKAWKEDSQLTGKSIGVQNLEFGRVAQEDRWDLIQLHGWTFAGDKYSGEACDGIVSTSGYDLSTNKIEIYPNPTYHNISIKAEPKELESLTLLNANGQDVSGLIQTHTLENGVNIDLSRLSPGLYVLRTLSNTTKVIKM